MSDSNKTINQLQDEIIDEFSLFHDWEQKYEYLLDLADRLDVMDEHFRSDIYLVPGCNSKAWLRAELHDGKVHYFADGETQIARGIMYLVLRVINGQEPQAILDAKLYFLERIGLQEHLTMTRAQGLEKLLEKVYSLAAGFCCCR